MRHTTSGAAGNGLGTTIKYLRRTTSVAAGNGLSRYRELLMCLFTTIAPHLFFVRTSVANKQKRSAEILVQVARVCVGLERARCVHCRHVRKSGKHPPRAHWRPRSSPHRGEGPTVVPGSCALTRLSKSQHGSCKTRPWSEAARAAPQGTWACCVGPAFLFASAAIYNNEPTFFEAHRLGRELPAFGRRGFEVGAYLAPHTSGPRDVPRYGTLSLLQKPLQYRGIRKKLLLRSA
jgi:hypothetical protein